MRSLDEVSLVWPSEDGVYHNMPRLSALSFAARSALLEGGYSRLFLVLRVLNKSN